MKGKQKPPRAGVTPKRSPVALKNSGAVMSIINQALAVPAIRVSLASYVEGRGLTGDWRLEIQSARLVPVDTVTANGSSA